MLNFASLIRHLQFSVALTSPWVWYASLIIRHSRVLSDCPYIAIPTEVDGGNHTPAFTKAAATPVAHQATLDVSEALAATGVRVLIDDDFFAKVSTCFFLNWKGV
jgi:hypothetical protein